MNNNTISVTIFVDTDKLNSLDEIEKAVKYKTRSAAKDLIKQILSKKEEKLFKEAKLTKKQKIPRYLYTIFGLVKFSRYKVKDRQKKFFYALDRAIGLEAQSSFSPGLAERATFLCTMYPYRQAKDIICYETSSQIDHRALWRLIQKKGIKLRQQDQEEIESLYRDAKPVESGPNAHDALVLEVDGTGISSKEGKGKWMEAKLAIVYTGKDLESKNSKVARYALKDKTVIALITDSDSFGKAVSYLAQKKYNLSKAKNVLLLSDGDPWIKKFHIGYMPYSIHQCDHYHLKKKLKQVYGASPVVLDKFLGLIAARKHYKLPYLIKMSKLSGLISGDDEEMLVSYIEANMESIWAIDKLIGKIPKELVKVGSGAVEKNIDIAIARRFKLRGMSWSKEGASNLLALRLIYLNKDFGNLINEAA